MLINERGLREFALAGSFPHEVKLRPLEPTVDEQGRLEGDLTQVIKWCTRLFGRPANQPVEEGFSGTHKVYQELDWMWDPSGRGWLFFADPQHAVLAKLTWG